MNIDYKQLGIRIANERKRNNLTQEQLAEKIGISSNYVSNIENNYSIPSLETLVKFCSSLNVTPDYFLIGTVFSSDEYYKDEIFNKINKCSDKEKRLIAKFIDWILDERLDQK
ncbi:MAG: helix-turn-helix domain-containing protein [Saccharofermentanales bacterium]